MNRSSGIIFRIIDTNCKSLNGLLDQSHSISNDFALTPLKYMASTQVIVILLQLPGLNSVANKLSLQCHTRSAIASFPLTVHIFYSLDDSFTNTSYDNIYIIYSVISSPSFNFIPDSCRCIPRMSAHPKA